MTEREIFLDALDKEDQAARSAYLDSVCAGKPELRRRVEELLKSHFEDDTFLEVSAIQQLASDERILTFLSPSSETDALGRLNHYHVLEVVGRGATGMVLKARDSKLERIVAIKVLAPRLAASPPARQRFVREARAVAAIRDEHVVGIHDVNDEGPLPYLVMDFISGITLADRIKQGRMVEVKEILRIGLQVANGLAAAHAQGLVHRDIKPGNILLENSVQRVKITDFGLARSAADTGLMQSGIIAGTPLFMSPCQARGEPTDARSDLFSLGAVLYTLCTGRPPFGGETTAAVLKSVCEDTPVSIREIRPDVPQWLCDLIGKLLEKEVNKRFSSAQELAGVLTGHLAREQQAGAGPSQTSVTNKGGLP
jgi:serine/threonine protein kinase